MKYYHQLGFQDALITMSEADELVRLNPDSRFRGGFGCKITTEDPTGNAFVRRAVEILARQRVPRRMFADTTSYGYYISRIYEPDDLLGAELLLLRRQEKIQDSIKPPRDDEGRLFLSPISAGRVLTIGRVWPNWIVTSHKVRCSLEAESLLGLGFREVVVKGGPVSVSPEPLWELQSLITLPKMAAPQRFVHPGLTEPEPFNGDYSRIVHISDPPFLTGEVHYRRSDLEQCGPFDIAQTFENYMEPHPGFVISAHFYRCCLQNQIPINVEPVRIDPNDRWKGLRSPRSQMACGEMARNGVARTTSVVQFTIFVLPVVEALVSHSICI